MATNKNERMVRLRNTKGYRVIADGKHTTHKRIDALVKELNSIDGNPVVYKNYNNELTFNFDND